MCVNRKMFILCAIIIVSGEKYGIKMDNTGKVNRHFRVITKAKKMLYPIIELHYFEKKNVLGIFILIGTLHA